MAFDAVVEELIGEGNAAVTHAELEQRLNAWGWN